MPRFTISGAHVDLDRDAVEGVAARLLPDPIQEHYVVVLGRRYPPKQLIATVTGVDRADFTSHQARRILMRLGFVAARATRDDRPTDPPPGAGPHGGRQ